MGPNGPQGLESGKRNTAEKNKEGLKSEVKRKKTSS